MNSVCDILKACINKTQPLSTPLSRIISEKLIVAQLVKKFRAFSLEPIFNSAGGQLTMSHAVMY